MAIIIIAIIIMFIILICWTWHNLGSIENNKKILYIIISLLVLYILTQIVFLISTSGINYENQEILNKAKNIFVTLFTITKGLIIMPIIGNLLRKVGEEGLSKQQFKKTGIILLIIIVILLIFESNYLNDIQKGILEIYNKR